MMVRYLHLLITPLLPAGVCMLKCKETTFHPRAFQFSNTATVQSKSNPGNLSWKRSPTLDMLFKQSCNGHFYFSLSWQNQEWKDYKNFKIWWEVSPSFFSETWRIPAGHGSASGSLIRMPSWPTVCTSSISNDLSQPRNHLFRIGTV